MTAPPTPRMRPRRGASTKRERRQMNVEVVVEVPKGSRNKYEMNHETGEI